MNVAVRITVNELCKSQLFTVFKHNTPELPVFVKKRENNGCLVKYIVFRLAAGCRNSSFYGSKIKICRFSYSKHIKYRSESLYVIAGIFKIAGNGINSGSRNFSQNRCGSG